MENYFCDEGYYRPCKFVKWHLLPFACFCMVVLGIFNVYLRVVSYLLLSGIIFLVEWQYSSCCSKAFRAWERRYLGKFVLHFVHHGIMFVGSMYISVSFLFFSFFWVGFPFYSFFLLVGWAGESGAMQRLVDFYL